MAGATTAKRGERRSAEGAPDDGRPSPRFRRPSMPRPRTLVLLIVAVVVLGGGGGWLLYGSEWLRAQRVTVSGLDVLSTAEVRSVAAVPVGSPLISVDTGAIEERLRRELPRIDSLEVERSWPHTIAVKVTERKAALIIEDDGKYTEVDAKGVRFATVDRAPGGVARLELAAGESPSLRRFGTGRLLREAVRVAADLPRAVAEEARTVKVRSYDAVSVRLTGGRTVEWGSGEKGHAKAVTLTALMKAAPKARHFDVSVPTAPAVSGS
ncbi:cell division protein FtsQ/DivIB [Streptomyces tsukubensis]|uniref:Cell division protein FtsQ n=1 Tax=Streptomyces tsukubensis TaxID=83656 RepID=A0A1V4A7K7_9ACTN|nr:FtsQ-type POTRA domain-containing protein [Streptomyces tsukubensis]OON77628.1 cell division protein FtsQ [Streptomyces tsukubensis]QFR93133.1 FtsQ-type POTRA domain-containing protein [Streptomyces tsukubensis]